ncbi:MAG: hypothetical protein WA208_18495 [Thermoanaerobaculia bacterium]
MSRRFAFAHGSRSASTVASNLEGIVARCATAPYGMSTVWSEVRNAGQSQSGGPWELLQR